MKIGDRVRFLSETGGGKIAGFQGKNIVLVEDEDGFQIPTPVNEVVVVEQDDYSTAKVISDKMDARQKAEEHAQTELRNDSRSIKSLLRDGQDEAAMIEDDDDDPSERELTYKPKTEERKGGNQLTAYLAFVPISSDSASGPRFEVYFVNDSNYFLSYLWLTAEGSNWSLRNNGEVEPNTKLFLEEIGTDDINELGRVAVQLMAYKKDKAFILKPVVDIQFRIDPVKFYKSGTFQENDFFETPALLYALVQKDVAARSLTVNTKELKKEIYHSAQPETHKQHADDYVRRYDDGRHKGNPFIIKHRGDDDIVVIDLHADALLDTTAGMSSADILNYQLKKFHDVLKQYEKNKGQKIVFIHGKGEGVLRHAIINDLNYRYKRYQYQDASFQEYGYGATQVTIR